MEIGSGKMHLEKLNEKLNREGHFWK